jgi:hypothetical protein
MLLYHRIYLFQTKLIRTLLKIIWTATLQGVCSFTCLLTLAGSPDPEKCYCTGFEVLTAVVINRFVSRIQRRVVRWKATDVSKENVACIFKIEEKPSLKLILMIWRNMVALSSGLKSHLACYLLHASFSLGLFFASEDWGVILLGNIGRLSTEYTALYPGRLPHCSVL